MLLRIFQSKGLFLVACSLIEMSVAEAEGNARHNEVELTGRFAPFSRVFDDPSLFGMPLFYAGKQEKTSLCCFQDKRSRFLA